MYYYESNENESDLAQTVETVIELRQREESKILTKDDGQESVEKLNIEKIYGFTLQSGVLELHALHHMSWNQKSIIV